MAWDEDAVIEALKRIQPALDAMEARIQALEERPDPSGEPVHPDEVVERYPGGIELVYRRVQT